LPYTHRLWSQKQQPPSECRYPCTRLHCVTTQLTSIRELWPFWNLTVLKARLRVWAYSFSRSDMCLVSGITI
jgi:hypothetical protein